MEGELYEGEFEQMEHNGKLDGLLLIIDTSVSPVEEDDIFTAYTKGVHDEREKWKKKMADIKKEIGLLECYGDGNYPMNKNLYIDGKKVMAIIYKYTDEEQT